MFHSRDLFRSFFQKCAKRKSMSGWAFRNVPSQKMTNFYIVMLVQITHLKQDKNIVILAL